MSMNPAKRAKIENDLAATVRGILESLTALFETKVICMVSEDATSHRVRTDQISGAPDLASLLPQADSLVDSLYTTLMKVSTKLPKGETIRVELARLPAILMRLLRINATSPKGDKVGQSDFKAFLNQLPSLHKWTLNKLTRFIAFSPSSLIPFIPDLKDIMEHILDSKDAPILIELLLLNWAEPLFNEICKHLGRKVASLMLQNMTSAATAENIKMATLLSLLLKDVPRSGFPLSVSDALFERIISLMIDLPDQPIADFSDEYQSVLVECLAAGTVGSVPSYLSPRTPLVVKMIGMLAVHPLTGRKTIRACSNALALVEVAVHPVKAIAPVETATRLKRTEATSAAFTEEFASEEAPKTTVTSQTAFKAELNLDALNTEPEVESASFEPKAEVESKANSVRPEAPHAPQVISAPNVLMKSSALDDTPMEDDDEPLPELFLD